MLTGWHACSALKKPGLVVVMKGHSARNRTRKRTLLNDPQFADGQQIIFSF
jgi:hypothetical protein